MVLISNIQAFLAVKGHSHGPGELPVAGAKALAKLDYILFIQCADAHTDGGSPCRVAPIQDEDAPIPAHSHIVGIGKAASVITIVHNTDGFDVVQCYDWRSDRRTHFSPFPTLARRHRRRGLLPLGATVSAQEPIPPPPARGEG